MTFISFVILIRFVSNLAMIATLPGDELHFSVHSRCSMRASFKGHRVLVG